MIPPMQHEQQSMKRVATVCGVAAILLAACALTACSVPADKLHDRLLTLDTHLDTPSLFGLAGWDFGERHGVDEDGSQIDIPRMIEGGLDGGFFVTYIPQGPLTEEGRAAAHAAAHLRLDEIHAVLKQHAQLAEIALTSADARRIAATGKRVVFLSMENGYPVGTQPGLLAGFHARGIRMAGPVHFLNNDLGTSSTDVPRPEEPGLTALGRAWVQEANRLGILIDASHASNAVLDELLELSAKPIVLSHSGAAAVFAHARNVDDARLRRIAAKGGVIQVSAYPDYMVERKPVPERAAETSRLRQTLSAERTVDARQELTRRLAEVDARWPIPQATYEQFVGHLLHVIRVAGVRHAGIGIDFDGGGGVTGLKDAAAYPRITASLREAGLSDSEIGDIWSGNVLRILDEAQKL
jgi:membrane dipeptidase